MVAPQTKDRPWLEILMVWSYKFCSAVEYDANGNGPQGITLIATLIKLLLLMTQQTQTKDKL